MASALTCAPGDRVELNELCGTCGNHLVEGCCGNGKNLGKYYRACGTDKCFFEWITMDAIANATTPPAQVRGGWTPSVPGAPWSSTTRKPIAHNTWKTATAARRSSFAGRAPPASYPKRFANNAGVKRRLDFGTAPVELPTVRTYKAAAATATGAASSGDAFPGPGLAVCPVSWFGDVTDRLDNIEQVLLQLLQQAAEKAGDIGEGPDRDNDDNEIVYDNPGTTAEAATQKTTNR